MAALVDPEPIKDTAKIRRDSSATRHSPHITRAQNCPARTSIKSHRAEEPVNGDIWASKSVDAMRGTNEPNPVEGPKKSSNRRSNPWRKPTMELDEADMAANHWKSLGLGRKLRCVRV